MAIYPVHFPLSVVVVGLEKIFYSVSENDDKVEVCVVVKSECNIPFPFYVDITTTPERGTHIQQYL